MANSEIAPRVRYLEIELELDFVPGQCVTISAGGDSRHYSIASAPKAPQLGVLYDVLDGGRVTPRMAKMLPGDRIEVSDAFGSFVHDGRPSIWLATGTGIAPFASMIRSGINRDVTLIHGARSVDRFYFIDELRSSLGGSYTPCLKPAHDRVRSLEEASSPPHGVYSGSLSTVLRQIGPTPGRSYFLCGSSRMVVDMRDLLVEIGVPFDTIVSEIYL